MYKAIHGDMKAYHNGDCVQTFSMHDEHISFSYAFFLLFFLVDLKQAHEISRFYAIFCNYCKSTLTQRNQRKIWNSITETEIETVWVQETKNLQPQNFHRPN